MNTLKANEKRKPKITVSFRILEDEKDLLTKIGDYSFSNGVSKVLEYYLENGPKNGADENVKSKIQKAQRLIDNMNEELFLDSEQLKQIKKYKEDLEKLAAKYSQRELNRAKLLLDQIKGELG